MKRRVIPVLEIPTDATTENLEAVPTTTGVSLAQIIEYVPALQPILEFYSADPIGMAHEIGMVSPSDEGDEDELDDFDFGPSDWFEASAGLSVVQSAIAALEQDPGLIGRAIYDPTIAVANVLADLQWIEGILLAAQSDEVRFHLTILGERGGWQAS